MPRTVRTTLFLLLLGVNLSFGPVLALQFFRGDTKQAEELEKTGRRPMQFPKGFFDTGSVVCKSNSCDGGVSKPIPPYVVHKENASLGYSPNANSPEPSLSPANGKNGSAVRLSKSNLRSESIFGANRKNESMVHSFLRNQKIESVTPDSEVNRKTVPFYKVNPNNKTISPLTKLTQKNLTIASPSPWIKSNGSTLTPFLWKQKNESVVPTIFLGDNSEPIAHKPILDEKNEFIHETRQKNDSLVPYSILEAPERRNEPDKSCPSGKRWASGQCRQTLS